MSKAEWFRRNTWTDVDREDFNARLKRSRGDGNKAQYLRLQALHLAQAGCHQAALELLDRLFIEFPDSLDIAQAHVQKAESLALQGQTIAAINEYRAALQHERGFPNLRTNAWLDFGWFVLEKQLIHLHEEVASVLDEFRDRDRFGFPANEYRYNTIQALLAEARGEKAQACHFAQRALSEEAKTHSGLRYHATIGLVGHEHNIFADRLTKLATCPTK